MHQQLASGEARRQTSFSERAFKRRLQGSGFRSELIHSLCHLNCLGPSWIYLAMVQPVHEPTQGRAAVCPVMMGLVCSVSSPAATRDRWAARGPPAASKTEVLIKSYNISSISLFVIASYVAIIPGKPDICRHSLIIVFKFRQNLWWFSLKFWH